VIKGSFFFFLVLPPETRTFVPAIFTFFGGVPGAERLGSVLDDFLRAIFGLSSYKLGPLVAIFQRPLDDHRVQDRLGQHLPSPCGPRSRQLWQFLVGRMGCFAFFEAAYDPK